MIEIYSEVINMVAKGLIDNAIELFATYFNKKEKVTIEDDLLMLQVRLQQLKRDERLGIIDTRNSTIERNKISNALLSLLNDIQETERNSDSVENGLKLFIAYSHRDIEYKQQLDAHLSSLKRNKIIETWTDREILPGQDWANEIRANLEYADIILLLISADFLASDYGYSAEMYEALERHKKGELLIVPIVLRPCDWSGTLFSDIQFLNIRPISTFDNKDEAYSNIITNLRNIIQHRFQNLKETMYNISKLEKKLEEKNNDYNQIETIEALIDYYKSINKQEKVRTYTEIKDRLKFKHNIDNPIIINQFHIEGVSIYNDIHWNIQPNINILLGRNGYGKSHLIRLLPCLLRNEKKIMDIDYKLFTSSLLKIEISQSNETKLTHYNNCNFIADVGIVPMLAIPAVRNIHPNKLISPTKDEFAGELCEIGALHFINQMPFDTLIQDKLFVLGNELLKLHGNKSKYAKKVKITSPIVGLVNSVVNELTNNSFEISNVKDYFGQSHIDIEVITEGNSEPISMQKASQGTISLLSILILIYYYLKSLYPNIKEDLLLNQKAIVFIDEIDAHLHPIWQRKIIGILRKNFPNIQFIITAHSPLIVAGCYEREVSVLQKTENNKFSIYQFNENFIGTKIEDIYSRVFEIENIEDDETFLRFSIESTYKTEEDIVKRIEDLENKEHTDNTEDIELENLHRLIQVKEIKTKRNDSNLSEKIEDLEATIRALNDKISQYQAQNK